MRTIFPQQIEDSGASDTVLTQETPELDSAKVKFPKRIKHRGRVLATIYKPKSYPLYRVAWTIAGKRQMKAFERYGDAKRHADKLVKDLATGSQVAALTAGQARDAIVALECLSSFYAATGRRISLHAAITEFIEASSKLGGRTLADAVDGYLRTVVTVQRKDIKAAVEEFLLTDATRAKASEGQRAQLSAKYAYNRRIQLNKFADTHPNTALCELTKAHLDLFISTLAEQKTKSRNGRKASSAKSRNHYRAAIRQFLQWAVRKDYLSVSHRLGEADGLRPERANTAEVAFYSPDEFAALLKVENETMRPLIAIGGLAGLRTAELLRLDWSDVWRVPGHIEITAGKSKTRQRRLVEICPALAKWLEPCRSNKSGKIWTGHEITFQQKFVELCATAKVGAKSVERKHNGLRHSFCSFHLAKNSNENLTAAQAGNSPAMIHGHYKGLTTQADAEKWFKVLPPKAA
jgi:integrase